MKYANFLIFSFLLACAQSIVSQSEDIAYNCAKILVCSDEHAVVENEFFEKYICVVSEKLEQNFSEAELEKYYETLSQPEMQKILSLLQKFCGGAYHFSAVVVHKLNDAYQAKKHVMSSELLCLHFNKLQYEKNVESQSEKSSQDFYKHIIEWFFDFNSLQEAILFRHSQCASRDLAQVVDMYGWSEKTMLLTQAFTKMTLDNYYFYCLMLHAIHNDALGIALKRAIIESNISAHEIIKINKFLYSSFGLKALSVHKECMELVTKEFLENVQL